jgi:hypothetical protein
MTKSNSSNSDADGPILPPPARDGFQGLMGMLGLSAKKDQHVTKCVDIKTEAADDDLDIKTIVGD